MGASLLALAKSMYYMFGKSMEKVTYVWKIKLSRPWTFDNDSGKLRVILTSTDDPIQKYSSMFGFPLTNPPVNSQRYIKNECSDMA